MMSFFDVSIYNVSVLVPSLDEVTAVPVSNVGTNRSACTRSGSKIERLDDFLNVRGGVSLSHPCLEVKPDAVDYM